MAEDFAVVVGSRCHATASYIPVHDDEIGLNIGDLVQILYVYDDGWVLGKNKTRGEIGLLPGNFLSAAMSSPNSLAQNSRKRAEKRNSSLIKNLGTLGAIISSPDTEGVSPDSMSQSLTSAGRYVAERNGYRGDGANEELPKPSSGEIHKLIENMEGFMGISAPVPLQSVNPTAREAALKKLREHFQNNKATHSQSNIGTIRAMVAGDSGIGRTSFIYSFLSSQRITEYTKPTNIEINTKIAGLTKLTEIRASTLQAKYLRETLERFNLSFIEPAGLGVSTNTMRVIASVTDFHIWQFQTTDKVFVRDRSIPKSTLIRFLNSGTGAHSHIDMCIYGILHRLKVTDIQFIKLVSPYTVIVPVILKSDTLTPSEVFGLKLSILEEFKNAGVPCYGFGFTHEELVNFAKNGVSGAAPFAMYSSPDSREMVDPSKESEVAEGVEQVSVDTPRQQRYATQTEIKPLDLPHQPQDITSGYLNSRSEQINELDILRDSILIYYINDIRRVAAEKFVQWRASTLES